jgi:transposase
MVGMSVVLREPVLQCDRCHSEERSLMTSSWFATMLISQRRFTVLNGSRGRCFHQEVIMSTTSSPTTFHGPSADPEFAVVRPHAAGLDIGAEEIWAASPPGEAKETVRKFGTFTADLHALKGWLKERGVITVAMESTGVYWIPVYDVLERAGIEVFLVNARHVKSVTGRKTDLFDCQWLQKLHACGLLRGSFRPDERTVAVRALFRHRADLVSEASSSVLRMQKALTQMNVQLHHVVSDITGKTGLAIIEAIVAGERLPTVLATLRDRRCKHDVQTIAKALTGTWRDEHLFTIRQHLATWKHYQTQIADVDAAICAALGNLPNDPDADQTPPGPKKPAQDALGFDARTVCHQKFGVDLTAIEGIGATTAMTILSEIGSDFSRFPTSAAFCSWLGLAPNTRITGGKHLSSHTKRTHNRVNLALRQAAAALRPSKSALGSLARSLRQRLGNTKGIVAMAHRLARYVYAMVTKGTAYVVHSLDDLEQRRTDRQRAHLTKLAAEMGYNLVPQ